MTVEEQRLREGMRDLAEFAGWTDMHDRAVRASHRLTVRRRVQAGVASVAAVALMAVPAMLVQLRDDKGLGVTTPSASPSAPPSPSPSAPPSPSASASPSASPSATGGRVSASQSAPNAAGTAGKTTGPTGCPVSAQRLYQAVVASGLPELDSLTSLRDIDCAGRYATARPVPEQSGTRILFGYALPEREWIVLNVGGRGFCDLYVLDQTVRSRLTGC